MRKRHSKMLTLGKREDLGKKESGKPKVKSPVQKPSPGGLFDNDQEDDDLFAALAPKKPSVKPSADPTTSAKSKSGLFADEEEEDDMFAVKEQKTASSKRKLPAGAVSMFGGAQNPLVAAIKAQKSPRSDTDEEQTWSDEGNQSSVSSASISTNSVTRNSQRKEHSPSASSNSLFAEEPEDLFSGFQGKRENVEKSGVTSGAALTSGSGGAGLFSDDEDLFGSSSKPQVAAPSAVRARKSGLLFDAEDDDDSDFLSGSEVNSSAISKKLPETGRSEVEDDLFGTTRKMQALETNTTEVPSQSTVTTRKAKLSLFDDDDDDNDLFGVTPTATKPGAMSRQKSMEPEKRGSKSLFQGEDWLFGGADDNDPTVDLFGPKKPPKAKEIQDKAPPSVAPEGATTKSRSGGEVERTLQTLTVRTLSVRTLTVRTLAVRTLAVRTLIVRTLAVKTLAVRTLTVRTHCADSHCEDAQCEDSHYEYSHCEDSHCEDS
ncbi:hypothetical protein LSAT2_005891 [Lamellibrachia satsuma]|nr:hypothetical protein LSAT2_005891 [Lamellibrachia satsuma]